MNSLDPKKPRIYLAGPLYNEGERWYLEKLDQLCRDLGFETYLPHRDGGLCPSSGDGGDFFFKADREELDRVDLVLAVLNGVGVDAGTSWEIGYAFAHSCRVIGLIDDTRIDNPKANINLMIFHSVEICESISALESKLRLIHQEI